MRNFVTGTSVVAFKYKDGIIMGTDTVVSYGRLSRYSGIQRMVELNNQTLLGISGELSDMQHLIKTLNTLTEEDNRRIDSRSYHKMIQRIMYSARSEMEPMNLKICVGGLDIPTGSGSKERVLGCVDYLGNFYFSNVICTGIGSYLVLPFLRSKVDGREDEITREEAIHLVEEAMRILCYRDCNASNEIQIGYVDDQGVHISNGYRIQTNWEIGLREDEIVIE